MERARPWLWVAWWVLTVIGVVTSLLPGDVAAPLYRGLLASHLGPFAILAVIGVVASRKGQVWRVMVGMAVIAVGIEVAQLWVPGRACELVDLRDDGLGMAIGWTVVQLCELARRRWVHRFGLRRNGINDATETWHDKREAIQDEKLPSTPPGAGLR